MTAGTEVVASPAPSKLEGDLASALKDLEAKTKALDEANAQLEEAKKNSTDASSKSDTKFTKYKAQATAKVKRLEKQLEELQQVSIVNGSGCSVALTF